MPDYQDVLEAARRLEGVANRTPVMTSRTLDGLAGCRLFLKCESFQRMGAFKFRGAFNAISRLARDERRRGVVTHSSGNHAQAVALAAQLLGVRATIVMPEGAPEVKRRATEETYGATVVRCANTLAAREASAARLIEHDGSTLVHPYDNEDVIAGAGTAALELVEECGPLDALLAPIGGGGLLSGTILAARPDPRTAVYGAEPAAADDALRSLRAGRIVENTGPPATIADGLRTNLCPRTFALIREGARGIFSVTEDQILDAMRLLWERLKLVVEPSGATAVAAALSGALSGALKGRVGIIVSGGNVDLDLVFQQWRGRPGS